MKFKIFEKKIKKKDIEFIIRRKMLFTLGFIYLKEKKRKEKIIFILED